MEIFSKNSWFCCHGNGWKCHRHLLDFLLWQVSNENTAEHLTNLRWKFSNDNNDKISFQHQNMFFFHFKLWERHTATNLFSNLNQQLTKISPNRGGEHVVEGFDRLPALSFCDAAHFTCTLIILHQMIYIIIIIILSCFFNREFLHTVYEHRRRSDIRPLLFMNLKRAFMTVCVVELQPSPAATVYAAVCSWTCVWRLHLFVSGAKASTLQPASASWPERRMNGSEWIWSEPLWRLFVLKVLNWLTSGRLWVWDRKFSVLLTTGNKTVTKWKLERQLSFSHVFKENHLQFLSECGVRGKATNIIRDYLVYGGHVGTSWLMFRCKLTWIKQHWPAVQTEQFSAVIMTMISFYDWRILHNHLASNSRRMLRHVINFSILA